MGIRSEKVRYCDFCFKSEHESAVLIANDSNIHICDKCVDLCCKIIENYRMNLKAESSWEDDGGRTRE